MLRVAILHDPAFLPELPTLPATPAMRVIAQVSLQAAFEAQIASSLSNVIVADLRGHPDRTTILIRTLREVSPGAAILVIGAASALDAARDALHGGALGYVTRDTSRWALVNAIEAVAQGRVHVSRTGRIAMRRWVDGHGAGGGKP